MQVTPCGNKIDKGGVKACCWKSKKRGFVRHGLYTINSKVLRVSQRSYRYLITWALVVRTDRIYWREVRLQVGEIVRRPLPQREESWREPKMRHLHYTLYHPSVTVLPARP